MNVRFEKPVDQELIRTLLGNCFPTMAEARLVDALRKANRLVISLVGEVEGKVVGYVGFSPVSVSSTNTGVGLAPVAVLPEFRKQGIADKLIREGLEICRQGRNGFVVVLGEPGYYKRFGFKPASAWGLRDEYGGGDAFQALELRPGAIPCSGEDVRYAPEFAEMGN